MAKFLPKPVAFFLRRRLRGLLLGATATLIVVQIVALSPKTVEKPQDAKSAVDPETLLPIEERTLATGLPKGQVPEYSVDQFSYVSTQGMEKQWKLHAELAHLYNSEKIVHARRVKAFLYDAAGKTTVVTGKEAKYFVNQRDLEIFGDVKARFPDGFEMESQYLRYRPGRREIDVPVQVPVHGLATEGQRIEFDSFGMEYSMASGKILLPKSARLTSSSPTGEKTLLESDQCVIHRDRQHAEFTMASWRKDPERFVRMSQPSMFARARRMDLTYGDYSKLVNYLVAREDVLIRELTGPGKTDVGAEPATLKYATAGKAEFNSKRNVVVLTEFPQVYQDKDTVTGDVILLHRDTDIVEVEHSNAFSQGQP